MPVGLSSLAGAAAQFFDDNGNVLVGGKIYTYQAGTTTPEATYTDSDGAAQHTNPIILDAAGRVPHGEIWLLQSQKYKFVIKSSDDVLIVGTYDNISALGVGFVSQQFSGTGAQTVFTLIQTPANKDGSQVYINGVYQNKATYSILGQSLTFSETPPVNSTIEVMVS